MMKSFSIVIMFVLISQYQISGAKITIEQMEQAAAPVRMACIGKTKVSEDLLAAMKEGKFEDSKELKCYINCVLEMMQTMKRGKLNYASTMKAIDTMLPDELKDSTRNAVEVCKDSAKGIKDNCEAASVLLQCIFKQDPKFFFP